MSNILPGLLNQRCVYWPVGNTDRYGNTGYGEPEELVCQWTDTTRTIQAPDGTNRQITATVYLSVEVVKDGYLWLGRIEDAPSTPPTDQQIVSVDRFQDIDNSERLWVARV